MSFDNSITFNGENGETYTLHVQQDQSPRTGALQLAQTIHQLQLQGANAEVAALTGKSKKRPPTKGRVIDSDDEVAEITSVVDNQAKLKVFRKSLPRPISADLEKSAKSQEDT